MNDKSNHWNEHGVYLQRIRQDKKCFCPIVQFCEIQGAFI